MKFSKYSARDSEISDCSETYKYPQGNDIALSSSDNVPSLRFNFPHSIRLIVFPEMLQRNLLYTGVTRAKKGLILVGEKKAIYIAVKNDKITERNTRLAERLKENYFSYILD